MDRFFSKSEVLHAALAAGGFGRNYDQFRIQKTLFLIDRNAKGLINCPDFNFKSYKYGPFAVEIYGLVRELVSSGDLFTDPGNNLFILTPDGLIKGLELLRQLKPCVQKYMIEVSNWLFRLNFNQILSAIYDQFPEMAVNSIWYYSRTSYPPPPPPPNFS